MPVNAEENSGIRLSYGLGWGLHWTTRKEVQVPPTVLEMYVGRYGEPVLVVTVRREGDHLSIEENGEPK